MPKAVRGVLIECDPAIKSIIVSINSADHAYIVQELDDEHLVIQENMLTALKMKLDEVLKENQPDANDESE